MGLLGFCVAQLAQTLALSLSPASDIALLSTASPLWIALLAWLWLGERLNRRAVFGFGLAIGGLALILWPHDGATTGAGQRLLGDAIFLVNGLTWAYYRVRAAQVAITMYLQPLAGVLVAWALLHEPLGANFLAGAALVFGGVWLVTWDRRIAR